MNKAVKEELMSMENSLLYKIEKVIGRLDEDMNGINLALKGELQKEYVEIILSEKNRIMKIKQNVLDMENSS